MMVLRVLPASPPSKPLRTKDAFGPQRASTTPGRDLYVSRLQSNMERKLPAMQAVRPDRK